MNHKSDGTSNRVSLGEMDPPRYTIQTLNKEKAYKPLVMVREGDLCPKCGVGTTHLTGYRVDRGLIEPLNRTEGPEFGFQCDNPDCGAKWNADSKTITSKYNIESRNPKHDTKVKAATKGG